MRILTTITGLALLFFGGACASAGLGLHAEPPRSRDWTEITIDSLGHATVTGPWRKAPLRLTCWGGQDASVLVSSRGLVSGPSNTFPSYRMINCQGVDSAQRSFVREDRLDIFVGNSSGDYDPSIGRLLVALKPDFAITPSVESMHDSRSFGIGWPKVRDLQNPEIALDTKNGVPSITLRGRAPIKRRPW